MHCTCSLRNVGLPTWIECRLRWNVSQWDKDWGMQSDQRRRKNDEPKRRKKKRHLKRDGEITWTQRRNSFEADMYLDTSIHCINDDNDETRQYRPARVCEIWYAIATKPIHGKSKQLKCCSVWRIFNMWKKKKALHALYTHTPPKVHARWHGRPQLVWSVWTALELGLVCW